MKKLGFLLLFTLFLFGCSEVEEILDDFINEITEESESGEGIEEQAKGEEVIEPDQEPLDIGNGGIFTHRGDNPSDDITVEVIVHGVDFLSEIEIETKLNDKKDFFVVDIEVRNSGENKITSSHYPNILLHNSSGQESNHPLYKERASKVRTHTFETADLIPGGYSRGLVVIPLDQGEEIESLLIEKGGLSLDKKPTYKINIDQLNKTATDSPSHATEQLEDLREEYILRKLKDYDNKVRTFSGSTFSNHTLDELGLIVEPETVERQVEYLSEFMRDDNGRIIGIKFTKQ